MKRDLNLVRDILLWATEQDGAGIGQNPVLPDYSEETIAHHVHLMWEAGLVDAVEITTLDGPGPSAILLSVTWAGHDFIDAARDNTIWNKTKSKVRFPDLGGNPVGTLDEGEGHSCPGFRMREILQGEFLEERGDSAIMSWAGHPVNFDSQGVGQRVRFDVSGRNEQFANERTCVVLLLQVAAQ